MAMDQTWLEGDVVLQQSCIACLTVEVLPLYNIARLDDRVQEGTIGSSGFKGTPVAYWSCEKCILLNSSRICKFARDACPRSGSVSQLSRALLLIRLRHRGFVMFQEARLRFQPE